MENQEHGATPPMLTRDGNYAMSDNVLIVIKVTLFFQDNHSKQAGAEMSQAQLKLGWDFNLIWVKQNFDPKKFDPKKIQPVNKWDIKFGQNWVSSS